MAKAITSKTINLMQLDSELGGHGLSMNDNDPKASIITTSDDSQVTEAELEARIAAHIAIPKPEPTVADKLASVGLSLTDLKTALGL